jgi:hypothetical protein
VAPKPVGELLVRRERSSTPWECSRFSGSQWRLSRGQRLRCCQRLVMRSWMLASVCVRKMHTSPIVNGRQVTHIWITFSPTLIESFRRNIVDLLLNLGGFYSWFEMGVVRRQANWRQEVQTLPHTSGASSGASSTANEQHPVALREQPVALSRVATNPMPDPRRSIQEAPKSH